MVKFREGYVINPDVFWRPVYRISPFSTNYNSVNRKIVEVNHVDRPFVEHYFGASFFPVINGRQAISLALKQYDLKSSDEIYITTTSGNRYISSCVTNEIEKICEWKMEFSNKTKLIFVNHEFGYCHKELARLKKTGIPIIEDMALSFASGGMNCNAGRVGDFVIYSLPKFFPVSFGGVLKCNIPDRMKYLPETDKELESYFYPLMTNYLKQVNTISSCRIENFKYLESKFKEIGFLPYFEVTENNIPGVFMFKTIGIDLQSFKIFMQANGIESSVFYGSEAFYIPVHQGLKKDDLDFFYVLTKYFLEYGNK